MTGSKVGSASLYGKNGGPPSVVLEKLPASDAALLVACDRCHDYVALGVLWFQRRAGFPGYCPKCDRAARRKAKKEAAVSP